MFCACLTVEISTLACAVKWLKDSKAQEIKVVVSLFSSPRSVYVRGKMKPWPVGEVRIECLCPTDPKVVCSPRT